MDRLNKGQLREFTAVYHDIFTMQRIDPLDNLSEFRITHMTDNVGEVVDVDWTEMERKQAGYFVYFLTIDDRFDVGTQYNVYYRAAHPVDLGENQQIEQFIVVDQVSDIEGLLMSANTCNCPGSFGYSCT